MWGTRLDAPALRGIGWFAQEADRTDPPEYVIAGIDTIATGSEAVHYYCSYGVLAIFLQVLIAVDGEGHVATSESGARRIASASALQHATIAAAADGRLGPPGRLIVVDAEHGEQTWRWTGDGATSGGRGCGGALDWLSRP